MTDFNAHRLLEARGAERPDVTLFDFPDAALTDTSTEEIEFDQALSLAGRFGRDFLGIMVEGILLQMTEEHITQSFADHRQGMRLSLNTRTGAFDLGDPELIWAKEYDAAAAAIATGTDAGGSLSPFTPHVQETVYGEPFLYVAPRLFFRVQNQMDQTIAIGDMACRISTVSVRLSFRLFIELLERFADVTLL